MAKKKGKGQAAKKGTKKPTAVGGGTGDAPKGAGAKATKEKGGKRIFITLQIDSSTKAKLQAAADKKAGKTGASLAGYCREILAKTVATS